MATIDPNANLPVLPAGVTITLDATKQFCGNCFYSGRNPEGQLECWHAPPTVSAFPLPSTVAMNVALGGLSGVQWLVRSTRPPVKPEWTCGQFTAKPQITN